MNQNIRSYPTRKQWVLTGFVFCLLGISVVTVRLTWLSSSYIQLAAIAQQQNKDEEMIQAYLGVLRNHFPGNPYSSNAILNILQQVDEWKRQNNNQEALKSLKNLRATLYGIESFYQPFSSQLNDIEEQIQTLEVGSHE